MYCDASPTGCEPQTTLNINHYWSTTSVAATLLALAERQGGLPWLCQCSCSGEARARLTL